MNINLKFLVLKNPTYSFCAYLVLKHPPSMDSDASSGQHLPGGSRRQLVHRENVMKFKHLLQTQIDFFYEFFDRDEDVLCLAGASRATNHTIKLLRGTNGAFYFGSEGSFGLCRYQSLQMVATSCRLRNKIEFVDQCEANTSHCVEFIVTSIQRACFLAGAPRKYVLATVDVHASLHRLQDRASLRCFLAQAPRHCVIPSLQLKLCMLTFFDGSGMKTWFEDMHRIYDEEDPKLRKYRGLAFPVACRCEPLLIPSHRRIKT